MLNDEWENYTLINQRIVNPKGEMEKIMSSMIGYIDMIISEEDMPDLVDTWNLKMGNAAYDVVENKIYLKMQGHTTIPLDKYPVMGHEISHFLRYNELGEIGSVIQTYEEEFKRSYFQEFFGKLGEYIMAEHIPESRPHIKQITPQIMEKRSTNIALLKKELLGAKKEDQRNLILQIKNEYAHGLPYSIAQDLCENLPHLLNKVDSKGISFVHQLYNLSNQELSNKYFSSHVAQDQLNEMINFSQFLDNSLESRVK